MEQEKIEKLLSVLAEKTTKPVSQHLAEEIKKHIPATLKPHGGLDSFNIIIDLRISKLAAAAVIIITMAFCANLFERSDSSTGGIYSDCKLLLKYHFSGGNELSIAKSRYHYLLEKGEEAAFYGQSACIKGNDAILLQWKLPDGNYRVVFANLHEETVTAEELIKLQSQMLQEKIK